jgi:hypothetical protein
LDLGGPPEKQESVGVKRQRRIDLLRSSSLPHVLSRSAPICIILTTPYFPAGATITTTIATTTIMVLFRNLHPAAIAHPATIAHPSTIALDDDATVV